MTLSPGFLSSSITKVLKVLCAVFLFFPVFVFAQNTGAIKGVVVDSTNNEPIFGVNVFVTELASGAATELQGEFEIRRIPEGAYTLRFSYLSYATKIVNVVVKAGETVNLRVLLTPEYIQGDDIHIMAQAVGQVAAIKEQLQSNTIVNVVSEARIRELSDDNAAETVGRLPGVSIQRSGGEAQNVVIRGLSSRFTNITVGGTKLASTSLNERRPDLHMISSNMISGIELYKSLRPDMDADAVAGTVNFTISGAPDQPRTRANLQYGYSNHTGELGNYKGDITFSRRLLGKKLGVMATISAQGVDRSSDNLDAAYFVPREKQEGEDLAPIEIRNLRFTDSMQKRERYGASVILDYKFNENNRILFSNFANRMNRDEVKRHRTYNLDRTEQAFVIADETQQIDVLSSTLTGQHTFIGTEINWRLSRSQSLRDDPYSHRMNFLELGAFNAAELRLTEGPEVIPAAAKNLLDDTFLMNAEFNENYAKETDLGAQLDIKVPVHVNHFLNGYVKFGGKYSAKERERLSDQHYRRFDGVSQTTTIMQSIPGEHIRTPSGFYSVRNFIDPNFEKKNYLDGTYDFGFGLSRDRARQFERVLNSELQYYNRRIEAMMNNHWAKEHLAAAYIMSEINIGPRIMIMPGLRYEHDMSEYTAHYGQVGYLTDQEGSTVRDTTGTRDVGNWFPMVHMRLQLLKDLDLRLAWTKSVNRPNFDQVVPRERIHIENADVRRGITGLKPAIAKNYDAFLNYYTSRIGLISLGAYYKEIDDLIYTRNVTVFRPEENNLPQFTTGYSLQEPYNNPNTTTLKGLEIEWQSNFMNLPAPFNGLVLNLNYSRIWSETQYHQFQVQRVPGVGIVGIDTFRVAPMVLQSDHIANMTVGYDYKGFSGRVSMLYQGATLSSVGSRIENDSFTHALLRWDVSLRQRIFKSNASLSFNIYNLTNEPDRSYQSSWGYPTDEEYYGWSMDVGLRYDF